MLKIKSMRMTQGSLFSAVPNVLRIRVRFSSEPEIFLFVAASSMSPGFLCSVDTYCLSSGVKRPVIVFPHSFLTLKILGVEPPLPSISS